MTEAPMSRFWRWATGRSSMELAENNKAAVVQFTNALKKLDEALIVHSLRIEAESNRAVNANDGK